MSGLLLARSGSLRCRRTLSALALGLVLVACGTTPAAFEPVRTPVTVSRLSPPLLDETSGLAASRRDPQVLWALNDSGNAPLLFALNPQGNLRGRVRVVGVGNIDWEDLASFELEGRSWLLVADVGDNEGRRDETTLLILEEPDPARLRPGADLELRVAAYLPVKYPDGPRDCEGVAVDPIRREILLVSKRQVPAAVYRLPLTVDSLAAGRTPPAERIATLDTLPQPDPVQRLTPTPAGHLRSQPTGFDLSSDGCTAAVLTYGDVWLYQRRQDESWAEAFRRVPVRLPPPELAQAEAVAFSADGRQLLVTSEGAQPPLLRYDLPSRFQPAPW